MNSKLQGFLSNYCEINEGAYDLEIARGYVQNIRKDHSDDIRKNLAAVIADRSLTLKDYYYMTYVEFDDTEQMYTYLKELYAYLFEGAEPAPEPPPPF